MEEASAGKIIANLKSQCTPNVAREKKNKLSIRAESALCRKSHTLIWANLTVLERCVV